MTGVLEEKGEEEKEVVVVVKDDAVVAVEKDVKRCATKTEDQTQRGG